MRKCRYCGGFFPAEVQETKPGSGECTYCVPLEGVLCTPYEPYDYQPLPRTPVPDRRKRTAQPAMA